MYLFSWPFSYRRVRAVAYSSVPSGKCEQSIRVGTLSFHNHNSKDWIRTISECYVSQETDEEQDICTGFIISYKGETSNSTVEKSDSTLTEWSKLPLQRKHRWTSGVTRWDTLTHESLVGCPGQECLTQMQLQGTIRQMQTERHSLKNVERRERRERRRA